MFGNRRFNVALRNRGRTCISTVVAVEVAMAEDFNQAHWSEYF